MTKPSKQSDRDLDEIIDELMEDQEGSRNVSSTLDPNVINILRRGRHIKPMPTLDEIDSAYD